MTATFTERLLQIQARKKSVLCVGLDPDPARMPPHLFAGATPAAAVVAFNTALIEATAAVACAYKLNLAFYEALGAEGWRALEATCRQLPDDVLVIADGKRGDIGNSARFYARSVFEQLGCDACTVTPYMGHDAVQPFLAYPGKAAFVLARTSNPGAADFQERDCRGEPLYLYVARQVATWAAEAPGDGGLVAGATSAAALRTLREACPDLPLLIPGVGAQGGDARAVMQAAGRGPVLINSSRQILYAAGGTDFAEAAAREAERLRQTLEAARGRA
ncbi:MAG: orotidine 5'-phosphate decarboxylase [Rhodothermaceae bacterium]|nr:MAG: orotidine 5'-phosphate decarboxylase [Rhodothermaceae bacterium]